MQKSIRIGIDLATRKSGIVILNTDDKVIYSKTLILDKFSHSNMEENFSKIKEEISYLLNVYATIELGKVEVFIELSKYGNSTTEMFSFYAGMIYAIINRRSNDIKVSFIEPRVWQSLMLKDAGISVKLTGNGSKGSKRIQTFIDKDGQVIKNDGKTIKNIARYNLLKLEETNGISFSEDECDAFNIAWYGTHCKKLWNKEK